MNTKCTNMQIPAKTKEILSEIKNARRDTQTSVIVEAINKWYELGDDRPYKSAFVLGLCGNVKHASLVDEVTAIAKENGILGIEPIIELIKLRTPVYRRQHQTDYCFIGSRLKDDILEKLDEMIHNDYVSKVDIINNSLCMLYEEIQNEKNKKLTFFKKHEFLLDKTINVKYNTYIANKNNGAHYENNKRNKKSNN